MSLKLQGEAPAGLLDWSPFAQQIVEDTEATLGFPFIILTRFDPVARTTQPVFISGMQRPHNQRALRLGKRLVPRFELYGINSIDANPLLRANFEGCEPVTGSVEEFTRGLVPPVIARIAGRIAGAAYILALPLCVEDRVLGCLSFFQRSPHFDPAWCIQFAPLFAENLRHREPRRGSLWHLDEVCTTADGIRHWLWTSTGSCSTSCFGGTGTLRLRRSS